MNNERILELALAADPDIGRTLGDLNGKCWIAANGIRPQSVVKFAELIVRECAKLAEYAKGDTDVDYQRYFKEHFGLNGMSTEDKKTLIKELLGVKTND